MLKRTNAPIAFVDIGLSHFYAAFMAYRSYAKGSGNPAQPNIGDDFACAAATQLAIPLLFKRDDFSKTDMISALR
jgi:ribonuclease VapC